MMRRGFVVLGLVIFLSSLSSQAEVMDFFEQRFYSRMSEISEIRRRSMGRITHQRSQQVMTYLSHLGYPEEYLSDMAAFLMNPKNHRAGLTIVQLMNHYVYRVLITEVRSAGEIPREQKLELVAKYLRGLGRPMQESRRLSQYIMSSSHEFTPIDEIMRQYRDLQLVPCQEYLSLPTED